MRAKELREEARNCLQGKWGKAIAISILYALVTFIISLLATYVHPILGIITFIIAPALSYGVAHSYYHLKNGEEVGYFDFLKVSFSNFGRGWGIAWHIFLKVWWMIFLILIPAIIISVGVIMYNMSYSIQSNDYYTGLYSSSSSYSDYLYDYDDYYDYDSDYNHKASIPKSIYSSNSTNLKNINNIIASLGVGIIVAIIIYIVLMVLVSIRMLLYTLSYYIAVAKENISTKEAVNESARLMKGNRGRYFCLVLSFIGWALLLGLASGFIGILKIDVLTELVSTISTAVLAPYIAFATIAFYKDVERENNITNTQNYAYVSGNNSNINNQNIQIQNGYQVDTENTTLQNDKKYCSNCGTENQKDAMFCTNCGNKF